ncbi:unnamed protein product [Timema podura]|uniref:Pacifastin domain-containing protein n=1 Tax=Timema podura TaxID=61482 RepID=A0ABN7P2A0_TIMPD|nr:unnamed protein product [Timema podura]
MEDCNICKCNNDGTSFACTRRGCPPKQEGGKNLERHTRGNDPTGPQGLLPPNRSVYPIPHSWTSKSVTPVNVTKKEQLHLMAPQGGDHVSGALSAERGLTGLPPPPYPPLPTTTHHPGPGPLTHTYITNTTNFSKI